MQINIGRLGAMVALLFLYMHNTGAQVTQVDYKIEYNAATCMYDVSLVNIVGTAATTAQRVVRTSHLTLVVPTGSVLGTQVGNEPKNLTSGNGQAWNQPNVLINPESMEGYDLYDFTAPTSNTRYSVITTPELLLFSIPVSTVTCGAGIRLYANGADPNDTDPGMGGGDWSQSFKIGQGNPAPERYHMNEVGSVEPPLPGIINLVPVCTASDLVIDLTAAAGACGGGLSYNWSGPGGYSGSMEDVLIAGATGVNAGEYKVTVTSDNGCTVKDSIVVDEVNCLVLPVVFGQVGATASDCSRTIYWVTYSEQDNRLFRIERSLDGIRYEQVGQLAGKGTVSGRSSYEFTDDEWGISGRIYYRICQEDMNGSKSYSRVVSVTSLCNATEGTGEIIVYPNPAKEYFNIVSAVQGTNIERAEMLDRNGNIIRVWRDMEADRQNLSTGDIKPGIYLVRVTRDDKVFYARITVID